MQVADTGISLNQSKAEHQLGKMRISVMRARNQQKWGIMEIWQNLDIGQFCQASKKLENPVEDDDSSEGVNDRPGKRRRRRSQDVDA